MDVDDLAQNSVAPEALSDAGPSDLTDLLEAANSTLAFWDNPADDAYWNDVPTQRG
jgi:hypothetical protein